MTDGVPLPAALSGVVQERLISIDKSLFFIVAGALEFAVDRQPYAETGTLTEEQTRVALGDMLWGFYHLTPFTLPVGTTIPFAGATIPTGYLECDGANLLRATYAELFAVIGTVWGSVDGTHFNLPDLRGRAPIGVGSGSGLTTRALADSGGAETHILTLAQMPNHAHTFDVDTSGTGTGGGVKASGTTRTADDTATTATNGSSSAHNNMQPFKALKFIIYAGG